MSVTKASRRRAPDWAAVRRLYEEGGTTVAAIAAAHGITTSAILKRRAAEGWPKRSVAGSGSSKTAPRGHAPATGRNALIARLLRVVDRNLKLMEMHMDSGQPGTAADRERESRAIGTLTRTIEKLTELQSETDAARAADPKNSSGSPLDDGNADRLRLEIAERILRLGAHYASR